MSVWMTLPLLGVQDAYLRYGGAQDRIASKQKLTLKIEGTEPMIALVRSSHPFMSLQHIMIQGEGTRRVHGDKVTLVYSRAKSECRYDDENHTLDFEAGDPPPGDSSDKVKQLLYMLTAGGRNYTLSSSGAYRSSDENQDHMGEAMDLLALGIVRLAHQSVKAGETFEQEWRGTRAEKNKKGVFVFKQKVTVEKVDPKTATLSAVLTGRLDAPESERNKGAEEAWTKVEGSSKVVLELETGRVLSSEGAGKIVAHHRARGDDGAKNEVTITFGVEGKFGIR